MQKLSPDELKLLDDYAGRAMQALIAVGATETKTIIESGPGPSSEWPDSIYYFGDDPTDPSATGRDDCALTWDAFIIAKNMILSRRDLLADWCLDSGGPGAIAAVERQTPRESFGDSATSETAIADAPAPGSEA